MGYYDVKIKTMNTAAIDTSPRLFRVQDGAVTGNTGQEDANNFAADFQGLRHFGNAIGEALDLGPAKLAALQETDFAHLWRTLDQEGNASLSELHTFALIAPEV
jgi:hypothetical protein